MAKERVYENIEVTYEGKKYHGQRAIEGKTKLTQYVIYRDLCIVDSQTYKPVDKDKSMLGYAQQILTEIVSGRTISAQPKDKYGL